MNTTEQKTLSIPKVKKTPWRRPVRVTFRIEFDRHNRKVTPSDLDAATHAAAAAYRASLEGRYIPYEIERFEVSTDYSYVQHQASFEA